jgi:hypothetical protein
MCLGVEQGVETEDFLNECLKIKYM